MESVLLASPGRKVCVSVQSLHASGSIEKGFIVSDENEAYFDLYDEGRTLVCMDGETCIVKSVDEDGAVLANANGEIDALFRLSWNEFEACCRAR